MTQNASDDLDIFEDVVADAGSPRVWRGVVFSFAVLVLLTMVALGVVVFLVWGISLIFMMLSVPSLPVPLY